jgi:hypothetical protein
MRQLYICIWQRDTHPGVREFERPVRNIVTPKPGNIFFVVRENQRKRQKTNKQQQQNTHTHTHTHTQKDEQETEEEAAHTITAEGQTLVAAHAFLEVGIDVAGDVRRTRATHGDRLSDLGTTERDSIYSTTVALVPAGTDNAGHQVITVAVAHLLKKGCGCGHLRRLTKFHTEPQEEER